MTNHIDSKKLLGVSQPTKICTQTSNLAGSPGKQDSATVFQGSSNDLIHLTRDGALHVLRSHDAVKVSRALNQNMLDPLVIFSPSSPTHNAVIV